VLSEIAPEFDAAVYRWQDILAKSELAAPDANDVYLFYQLMIGAWPPGLLTQDRKGIATFEARLQAAMLKSVREAKVHTNWAAPDEDYEAALRAFVGAAFANGAFLDDFLVLQQRVATLGAANSLVQTVLKFTVPGVPDIYQGAEAFDLSLVDPDNRRAIDWTWRRAQLDEATKPIQADHLAGGSAKVVATVKLLALRRENAALFADGTYQPIDAADERIIAFSRQYGSASIVVVSQRFPARGAPSGFLPMESAPLAYIDILTSRRIVADGEGLDLSTLLSELPTAVLVSEQQESPERS
jgi:(1->4)-alpha-D-glucan 1-alpha-D-glucosylmutase